MKHVDVLTEGDEHNVLADKINAHRLDKFGRELVDSRPMAPPVGYVKQPSMFQQMREMMHRASLEAAQAGEESFEEANDFYVEDDPDSRVPPSRYEFDEDAQLELEQAIADARNPPLAVPEAPPAPVVDENPSKAPKSAPEPSAGSQGAS